METQQNRRLQLIPCLFVLLQGLIYGLGDASYKLAVVDMPHYSLLSLRYLLATLLLLPFAGRRMAEAVRRVPLRAWLPTCLCMAGTNLLGNMAMALTAATSVAFLRSLATVMTPLLAMVVMRKWMSRRHIPIQLLVVLGLYLLCGRGGLSTFGMGEILALLAALLLAGSLVFGETALEQMDSLTLTGLQTVASAVLMTLCAFLLDGGWNLERATVPVWLTIVYLAVPCSILGIMLQNVALKRISSRAVALLQCFCPVMTAVFSRLILDERLSTAGMIGAAIILICVAAETTMKDE